MSASKPSREVLTMAILNAYWHLRVASENLLFLKGYKNEIDNEDIVDAIKQVSAKANYFTGTIDKAFNEARVSKLTLAEQDEMMFRIVEETEKIIKEMQYHE